MSARSASTAAADGQATAIDLVDAVAWGVVSFLVLALVPVGWASGDALAQAARYGLGLVDWDPNHLLLEPVGALWLRTLQGFGLDAQPVDILKLLSALAGALAVAIFRALVAPGLASTRWSANHATLWLAGGSAYLRMWISGEAYMLQMPFLALGTALFRRVHLWPGAAPAVAAGAAFGAAALFFVSNLVTVACLGIVFGLLSTTPQHRRPWARRLFRVFATGGGAATVVGVPMLFGWARRYEGPLGLLEWVTSYAGGRLAEGRSLVVRSIEPSLQEFGVSAMRTVYGALGALVDLTPIVETLRDGTPVTLRLVATGIASAAGLTMVALAALNALRDRGSDPARFALLLAAGWTVAIAGFMLYWDNSDAQFYFQLSIPIACLIALLPVPGQRGLVFLTAVVVGWNLVDIGDRFVTYPRVARTEALRTIIDSADLIVYPGNDEVDHLLFFLEPSARDRSLSVALLADRYAAPQGLQILRDTVLSVTESGGRVAVVDVFDVPARRQPWKALEPLGYRIDDVRRSLEPVVSRRPASGPFSVRVGGGP